MASDQALTPRENRFLAALPDDAYRRLVPHLGDVALAANDVIYEHRGPIRHAYFPAGGVLSALAVMENGDAIEVATVGREGLVGHSAARGSGTSPTRMIVQIAGRGWRIPIDRLRDEDARAGALAGLLDGYESAFLAQVAQSVACNGLHRLEQRCCRWLLMSRDRVGSDEIHLTHDFLAIMLGARRASVTEALRPLAEAGLIRSRRGTIRILDGAGLEARACECYGVVKGEYERLLGLS